MDPKYDACASYVENRSETSVYEIILQKLSAVFLKNNFVDVSLGQNFECFVSNKVTKQNTKVMIETLFLSRAKHTSFAV